MAPETFRTRSTGFLATLGGAGLGVAALAYIGVNDPHRIGSPFPPCPFRALTGWYCPGCGGLRMTYDLLHADLAAAAVDNLVLLVGLPALLVWWLLRRRMRRPAITPAAIVVVTVILVAWTVVRNVPGFPLIPTVVVS